MSSALDQINTSSRAEMVCPNCGQRGLTKAPKYAAQCDNKKQEILYATACTNPECENHSAEDSAARVPPEAVKRQYSAGNDSIVTAIPISGRGIIGIVAIAALAGLLLTSGSLLDNGGSAQANPYDGMNESESGVTVVDVIDPWTIYESNGDYYVAAVRDGKTVYLNRNGEVVDDLVVFSSSGDAEDAITEWQLRDNQGLVENPPVQAPEDLVDGSPWAVYEYNGSAFIAAERNGSIIYMDPSLDVGEDPYLYDNVSEARDTLIEYESSPSGLINDTQWQSIEYGDEYFAGANPDTGPYDGDTVYLYPNGTVSEDPVFYDSPEDANDAIDNFDGWDDVEQDPIDFDGGGGDNDDEGNDDDNNSPPDYSTPENGDVQDDLNSTAPGGNLDDNIDENENTEGVEQSSAVRGSVTDNSGDPVEGATVHVYSEHYTTETNSSGEYEITGIPSGEHEVHVEPPADSDLAATENVTITIGSEGIINVEETATSTAFIQNGVVSQNRINFSPQSKQPLQATGEGTNVSAPVMFRNSKNAEDIQIKFDGQYSEGVKSSQISSTDGITTVTTTGTAAPQTQKVAVNSRPTSSSRSIKVTDGDTFTPDGNLPGTDARVKLKGQEETAKRTITGTGDGTVTNNGNKQSDNTSITLVGAETSSTSQYSGTGDGSIANTGNLEGTAEITLEGSKSTDRKSTHKDRISTKQTSGVLNLDSNKRTQDVSVTISSGPRTKEKVGDIDGRLRDIRDPDGVDDSDIDEEARLTAPADGTYYIPNNIRGNDYYLDGMVWHDASLAQPRKDASIHLEVLRSDGDRKWLGHGTIACGEEDYHDYPHCNDNGANTGDGRQAPQIGGETVYLEKGDQIRFYKEGSGSFWFHDYPVYRLEGLDETNVEIEANGETKSKTVTVGANETQTVQFESISSGDISLEITGQGAPESWGYNLEATEVSVTEDPQIDVNNDGIPEAQYKGKIGDRETVTREISLQPGNHPLTVTHSGPTPGWTATVEETTATKDITLSVPGTDIPSKTVSGPLQNGEEATVDVSGLPPGEHRINVEHSGPQPSWETKFIERSVTKSPTVTIGEGTLEEDGFIEPNEETVAPGSSFGEESYQIETSTVSGPQPVVVIEYKANAIADDVTVSINGENYRYPDDFDSTGPVTRQTHYVNTTALNSGDNKVAVSSSPIDGIKTDATAKLRYPSTALQTSQPTVHVIQPDGSVTSKSVPQAALTDGQLTDSYTASLGKDSFGDGENTVIVETPDDSKVGIKLSGTSAIPQSGIFEPTETVPHNATLP